MHYLFLDSTNGLTLGLLDQEFNWVSYCDLNEKKPSEVLHSKVQALLDEEKLDFKDISLVAIAGPGSYTGMRLSEGFANIVKLSGTKVFSLFHFEIPKITGIEKGIWATNAFKGQTFFYEWDNDGNREYLLNNNDVNWKKEIFSNNQESLFENVISTKELLRVQQKVIFKFAVERGQFFPAFYFRSLDEEFKGIC
jgi:tRNA threonylcarbamoyladenosine biosynthesis protein TsaB